MRIERQVKRKQIEVVLDERSDALAASGNDPHVFASPKITVMDYECVRAGVDGSSDEVCRSRHSRDDALDMRCPFHLQPVWAIISKPHDVQVLVEVGVELCALHQRPVRSAESKHFIRTAGHPTSTATL